jgi:hypothetical protein
MRLRLPSQNRNPEPPPQRDMALIDPRSLALVPKVQGEKCLEPIERQLTTRHIVVDA